MLVYFPVNGGAPIVWGQLLNADTGYSVSGSWAGSIGVLTTAGAVPWSLGHRANGYHGTFALVCPE